MAAGSPRGSYLVATILAVGICLAFNVFTFAVLWDALANGREAGISENAVQVLTGWGSGILGVIGTVVGYQAGHQAGSESRK